MSVDLTKAVGLTIWGLHRDGYRTTTQLLILQMLVTAPEAKGLTVQDVMSATGCSQGAANKTFVKLRGDGLARKNVSSSHYEYFATARLKERFEEFVPEAEFEALKREVAR